MKYDPKDYITCLVDTREQDTDRLRRRLKEIEFPCRREKLNYGDYSAECLFPDGTAICLKELVVIERKMSIDELAACFTSERKRFTAEFERAKQAGAKIYLLVENASWDKIYKHAYRSQMSVNALAASIFCFTARYNCNVIFCEVSQTGKIIKEILLRETKERCDKWQSIFPTTMEPETT